MNAVVVLSVEQVTPQGPRRLVTSPYTMAEGDVLRLTRGDTEFVVTVEQILAMVEIS